MDSSKDLVLNATPLIYLCKIGLSNILKEFPETKYVPPMVIEETVKRGKILGAPDAFMIEKLVNEGIIRVKKPIKNEFIRIIAQIPELHDAEVQVIALAKELGGIAILDDSVARQVAKIFNIEVHGTVYLILRRYYEGKISKKKVKVTLDKMIAAGWWISAEDYAKILDELNVIK